uniref:Major facilitator superfamily (MFS) profile domain-containing protein n=1 Tax=Psilocybe cubensis TaxID=181762 RepID=A0A8H7XKU9_PSICU
MDRWGRRGSNRISALLITFFTAAMGLTSSIPLLLISRFMIGIASGLGLCVGPIYLAEIAPLRIRGSVGILTQLAIVSGVMGTQIAGINLAYASQWRLVFLVSFILSVLQLLSSSFVVESPAFLSALQRPDDHKAAAQRLWGNTASDETSLLDETDNRPPQQQEIIFIPQLLVKPELRRPLAIVSLSMIAQQISGVTAAVFYYSNDLLAKSLPQLGAYISLGITIINVLMTFPPIFLIERTGRRSLLTTSILGALLSLVTVGFALDSGFSTLASIAIVTFVMFYAIGLGPIPFVMIPDVSPPYAVSALSSVALSTSWSTSFLVGLVFLPIRNILSGGDMYKEGRVFYVFGLLFGVASILLFRFYR